MMPVNKAVMQETATGTKDYPLFGISEVPSASSEVIIQTHVAKPRFMLVLVALSLVLCVKFVPARNNLLSS